MRKASNNWNLAKDFLEKENVRLSLRWCATAPPTVVKESSKLGADLIQMLHEPLLKDLLAATVGVETASEGKSGWIDCSNGCFVRSAEWESGRGSMRKDFKAEMEASGALDHMLRRAWDVYPELCGISSEEVASLQQYGQAMIATAAIRRRQAADRHLHALEYDSDAEDVGDANEGDEDPFSTSTKFSKVGIKIGDSVRVDLVTRDVEALDEWAMAHWTEPDIALVRKIWVLGAANKRFLILEIEWMILEGNYVPCRGYNYALFRKQTPRERSKIQNELWFTPEEVIDKAVMLPHRSDGRGVVVQWIYLREAFPV